MVDGITGLTFLYLARHPSSIQHQRQHWYPQRFHLFCRTHYSALCFYMRPTHYLQLAATALICDNVPLPLCCSNIFFRHIRVQSTSVDLIMVDMVEMSSTERQANPLLTLLVSGFLVHSISGAFLFFFYMKPFDLIHQQCCWINPELGQ